MFRDTQAREGSRRAYNEAPVKWYLYLNDKIHGGRPFHRVHIDHTLLDVVIRVRGFGGRIYRIRPWLTVIIDAETRAALAFYLAAHTPSTVSCMMAIRAMVATHKRMPDFIVCDNGQEFHSDAFDELCDLNDVTIDFRPAHESRFGGVIERLFGTTNQLLISNMVGNTKATKHVRTLTTSVDPINADHLSFVELHGLLDYFFFTEYNRERIHPAHDHTPNDYMNKSFAETGRRLSRVRPFDHRFMIQTLVPAPKRGDYSVNPQMGVKVGPIWYTATELTGDRNKKKRVKVMLDMWDISIAYVLYAGRWVKCASRLLMRYRLLTHIELRYALYEVRLRLKAAPESMFETLLDEVLVEHDLPRAADATAGTRELYQAAGIAAVHPRTIPEQAEDACLVPPASRQPTSSATQPMKVQRAAKAPSATRSIDSSNHEGPPAKKRFNVDFAALPIRKSL